MRQFIFNHFHYVVHAFCLLFWSSAVSPNVYVSKMIQKYPLFPTDWKLMTRLYQGPNCLQRLSTVKPLRCIMQLFAIFFCIISTSIISVGEMENASTRSGYNFKLYYAGVLCVYF